MAIVPDDPNTPAATVVPLLSALTTAPVVGLIARKPPSSHAPPPLARTEPGPGTATATAAVKVSAAVANRRLRPEQVMVMERSPSCRGSRSVRPRRHRRYR